MKIEFESSDAIIGAMRDMAHAIVVAQLKEAVKDAKAFNHHPGDRKYNKKLAAAAKVIIHHFGG